MGEAGAVFTLCGMNFRKWLSNSRIKIVLLLIVLMIESYMRSIRSFTNAVQVSVTPWSLPFLMATFNSLIIIMLGFIFLYCDAPFLDEQQPYLIIRVGRKKFVCAQILYIVLSSLIYTIFIFTVTLLCSLPRLEFSLKWGKIFKTLALTDAASQFDVGFNVPNSLMLHYSPLQAMGLELLLIWLIGCFLGLMIFVLNIHFSRVIGTGCAALFVFLDMFADFYRISHGYSSNLIYFFSPVSWANLTIFQSDPSELLPTLTYALTILLLMITAFILIALRSFKKKEIEVLPQI